MSEREHDALAALRRVDGPADLADGVEERIEAEMLERFDARIGDSFADDGMIVELEPDYRSATSRKSRRPALALATAAAVVAAVAGSILLLGRDDQAPSDTPATTPPTTAASTTAPAADETALATQLATFCAEYLAPARDADATWQPDGLGSGARTNVVIAVEQAAQALSDLPPPLGDRLAAAAGRLLDAATEARLAVALAGTGSDDDISQARDLLFAVPSTSGVTPLPESCTTDPTSG